MAEELRSQLEDLQYSNISIACNSDEALVLFQKNKYDFLIIDIGLEGSTLNGIELCEQLQSICLTPAIFLSGYSDQETLNKVNAVTHSNYLIKPCSTRQLFVTIDKAITDFTKKQIDEHRIPQCHFDRQNDHFYIKANNNGYDKVNVTDLAWVETVRGGIEINTIKGKVYMLTASLNSFMLQFKNPKLLRVHRSYLINREHIGSIKDRSFVIACNGNNKFIPCSQSYWNDIKAQFKTLRSD
jgi:DNA-binding LytR/AlgR family response regulator